MLQPADNKEPTGYPTQKPEVLLQRIIQASSNKNSIIFDCFMGSGTTQAVAMKLGRKFIGADINLGAIQTTTKRLIKVAQNSQILNLSWVMNKHSTLVLRFITLTITTYSETLFKQKNCLFKL